MLPKVSVVINNYNYGRFLAEAIESVLGQDYPPGRLELWVVDDGSTDDSREVLARYAGRLQALLQENRGQAAALTAGIRAAGGEIVCLLDADDWWEPGKVRAVAERFAEDPRLGLVQHWCLDVDAAGRPAAGPPPKPPGPYTLQDLLARPLAFTGTSGLSFRREAVEPLLPIPEELTFCADEYLYTHVLFQAPAATIPIFLARRRIHGENRFASSFGDPARLERGLRMREILDAALRARLRERGLSRTPALEALERHRRLESELLLHRYRGRLAPALRAWAGAVAAAPLRRRPFKAAALAAALISPRLYLRLKALYARIPTESL